jgi:hypothetical protein
LLSLAADYPGSLLWRVPLSADWFVTTSIF